MLGKGAIILIVCTNVFFLVPHQIYIYVPYYKLSLYSNNLSSKPKSVITNDIYGHLNVKLVRANATSIQTRLMPHLIDLLYVCVLV